MQFIVILLLAAAWGAYFLFDLRERGGSSRSRSGGKRMGSSLAGIGRGTNRSSAVLPLARYNPSDRQGAGARPGTLRAPAGRPGAVTAPTRSIAPRSAAEAQQRQMRALGLLVGVAVLTLLASKAVWSVFFYLFILEVGVLAGYVYLLVEHRRRQLASTKVLPLRVEDDPVLDLTDLADDADFDDVGVRILRSGS